MESTIGNCKRVYAELSAYEVSRAIAEYVGKKHAEAIAPDQYFVQIYTNDDHVPTKAQFECFAACDTSA